MEPKDFTALLEQVRSMNKSQKEQFVKALGVTGQAAASSDRSGKFASKLAAEGKNIAEVFANAAANISELDGPLLAAAKQAADFREQNESFFRAGYSNQMFNFSKSIQAASDESYKLTGNFKAFRSTVGSFQRGFKGLGFVTEDFRKRLLKTGVALETAGFNMDQVAGIVDSAAFAFNKTEGEIEGITATLIKTSREFAVSPREISENFQFAQKNFAYTTGRFMGNFLELQKMSKTTGVSFNKLASSFGESMDTFKGSAQTAGTLNQILGKSVFNSIDLLGKTEAERAKTIREGIQERFGGRIENLQKFELKAVAKGLNMNVEEARRFLRGEPPKAMKDLKKLEEKDPVKMAAANLGNELDQLKEGVNSFRRPFERDMIALNSSFLKANKAVLGFSGDLNQAIDNLSLKALGADTLQIDGKTVTGQKGGLARLTADLERDGLTPKSQAEFMGLKAAKMYAGTAGLVTAATALGATATTATGNTAPGFTGPVQTLNRRKTHPSALLPLYHRLRLCSLRALDLLWWLTE